MQCLQLTRGEPPATTVDVALSGNLHSKYGYVTIDGTKYTSAQTLKVAKGTSVTVSGNYLTINLNGTMVAKGSGQTLATYTFSVTDNCSIVVTNNSMSPISYTADITMPA